MAIMYNSTPGAEVTISGSVTADNTASMATATTVRYDGAATQTSTVGAGKKWVVTYASTTYSGSASSVTAQAIELCYAGSAGVTQGVACHVVLTAGQTVVITKKGHFTYYEVDA